MISKEEIQGMIDFCLALHECLERMEAWLRVKEYQGIWLLWPSE
jgi:hypothetical protein